MKTTYDKAITIQNTLKELPSRACTADTILAIAQAIATLEQVRAPMMEARTQIFRNAGAPVDGTPEYRAFLQSGAGLKASADLQDILNKEMEEDLPIRTIKFSALKVGDGEKCNAITPAQIAILLPILTEVGE